MKHKFSFLSYSLALLMLPGCASYNACSLTSFSPEMIECFSTSIEGIKVIAKAFDQEDCKKYLDRDVLQKGYQPIQIFIENTSEKNFLFSSARINLSCVNPEEVAKKAHTSTFGRVIGYGAAAWFTFGIFIIPAIVDGMKSAEANEALDHDFSSKCLKEEILYSHSHLNTLIFVPQNHLRSTFTLTLLEQNSNEPKKLQVQILQ